MNLTSDSLTFEQVEDEYDLEIFPRRQRKSGKSFGLSILLDPDVKEYFCTNTDSTGFQVVPLLTA